MSFAHNILARERPDSVRLVALPRRSNFFPSPKDWRDEVIYFLLPDRFSDGGESDRPLVDPKNRGVNRPAGFRWDEWAASGGGRFQGGTLNGITSKLDYLNGLGVTTLWVGPTFKQRTHFDSYHGYAIQLPRHRSSIRQSSGHGSIGRGSTQARHPHSARCRFQSYRQQLDLR
jgi:alpha amylase-like protein